ncbi:hypothetical protein MMC28_004796 [Mycoblastus sanguinarius]|nr:hypothetical protein [Mycoblastus sanguinarius]
MSSQKTYFWDDPTQRVIPRWKAWEGPADSAGNPPPIDAPLPPLPSHHAGPTDTFGNPPPFSAISSKPTHHAEPTNEFRDSPPSFHATSSASFHYARQPNTFGNPPPSSHATISAPPPPPASSGQRDSSGNPRPFYASGTAPPGPYSGPRDSAGNPPPFASRQEESLIPFEYPTGFSSQLPSTPLSTPPPPPACDGPPSPTDGIYLPPPSPPHPGDRAVRFTSNVTIAAGRPAAQCSPPAATRSAVPASSAYRPKCSACHRNSVSVREDTVNFCEACWSAAQARRSGK